MLSSVCIGLNEGMAVGIGIDIGVLLDRDIYVDADGATNRPSICFLDRF